MKEDRWSVAIAGLGMLVIVATLVHVFLHIGHTGLLRSLVELVTGIGPALGVLYGASRVHRTNYRVARPARIFSWSVAGTVVASVLAVGILYIGSTVGVHSDELVSVITVSGAWGAAIGVLVGSLEAHSIEETHGAERARSRAREEQRQRATVEHLNALLRHNVLNAANVIEGTAEVLLQDADGRQVERLRTIRSRSEEMADLAVNVRTLLRAAAEDREERFVDIAEALEGAAEAVRAQHPSATVSVDAPESLIVRGDVYFDDALECLLSAAVRYGGDPASVTARLRRDDGTVRFLVETDGRLPARVQDRPFERTDEGDDDIRLLLVGTVIEPYGTASVVESDEEGTTFLLTFDLADDDRSVTGPAPASPAR